jgi:hypothetical protein
MARPDIRATFHPLVISRTHTCQRAGRRDRPSSSVRVAGTAQEECQRRCRKVMGAEHADDDSPDDPIPLHFDNPSTR